MILLILFLSLILSIQSIITIIWELYAWEQSEYKSKHQSPKQFTPPKKSFTALIPARHEDKVIGDTIKAVDSIDYPNWLKEVLILCRTDDIKTIREVKKIIKKLNNRNIRLILFDSEPINKPHSLNVGLRAAKNQIIGVFDAEDHPHREIYKVINTVFSQEKVDIVQSGIQLINYHSRWFSIVNVMEYYFWFKSGLHFFTNIGKATPLGGNSVFIKKRLLKSVDGWNENVLTEDAEIGFRLINNGAKTKVIYDEKHATLEETPHTINAFIKQRTRWNQGFMQILLEGKWLKLPLKRQRITAGYILFSPILEAIIAGYIPLSFLFEFSSKLPVLVVMLSFLPMYLFALQVFIYTIGFLEYKKTYAKNAKFWVAGKIVLVFYLYQLILAYSAIRACARITISNNSWEKTLHLNTHRLDISKTMAYE